MHADWKSLSPDFDRRAFLGTALAAGGFALAAGPARAQAVVTDAEGLDAGSVLIPGPDRDIPAYAARPRGGKALATILVVQEIFGVHEHIRDVCRRLGKLGYLAVAPELYVRQGDPSAIADIPTLLKTIVAKVPDSQVMADLDAAAAWAARNGGDPARLGITGFCWGGRVTWLYGAHNPALKAGVAWYGRLEGDVSDMTPSHPLQVASRIRAPILGLYGAEDQGIPLNSVGRMQQALAGSASEIVVFKDAPHAFHADYRASYRADAARDGWARMLAWFKAKGL